MQKLQLERIELREIELPLKSAFETSFGVTTKRRVALVRVVDASGVAGLRRMHCDGTAALQSGVVGHGLVRNSRQRCSNARVCGCF
jgi:hypothetical protein